jgi:hypothetical protein
MSERLARESLARAREHGRARIRLVTRRIAAASFAGCAVFAGLAAVDGKAGAAKTVTSSAPSAKKVVTQTPTTTTAPTQPTTTTQAPVVTVTPTQSAPVTASGGS